MFLFPLSESVLLGFDEEHLVSCFALAWLICITLIVLVKWFLNINVWQFIIFEFVTLTLVRLCTNTAYVSMKTAA